MRIPGLPLSALLTVIPLGALAQGEVVWEKIADLAKRCSTHHLRPDAQLGSACRQGKLSYKTGSQPLVYRHTLSGGSSRIQMEHVEVQGRCNYRYTATIGGTLLQAEYDCVEPNRRHHILLWKTFPLERAREGFAAEVAFWAAKQAELASEPDRRIPK